MESVEQLPKTSEYIVWFDPVVKREVFTVEDDPVIEELASGNPELLARLIALRGLSEVVDEEAKTVRKAGFILFSALQNNPSDTEKVVDWLNPSALPPMVDNFSREELHWINDYKDSSPFIQLAA